MKKRNLLSLLMILLLFTGSALHAIEIGIAATVQGQEITEARLQAGIDNYLLRQGTNIGVMRDPNRYNELREKILDVLIGQELLWQAARRDKIFVDDAEVDQAFAQYQAQFDDELSFNNKLSDGGFNKSSFQQNLKQQLSVRKWIQEFVLKDVSVSDAEVSAFYNENKAEFIEPEKIRARHILIKLESGASDEIRASALEQLSAIRQEIVEGANFASLASEKSQGPSAANGGDLGYFTRGQMVPGFEQAAFALAPGEVSEIVETRFGFHLIKLEDRKSAVLPEEKDLAERIRGFLMQEKSRRAVEAAVSRLSEGSSIEKRTL